MNPDQDEDFETVFEAGAEIRALLAYARSLNDQALGIAGVAHAIVTVIEAERRFARATYTILVTTSMVVAALFALGLILVPWDALARHVRSVARRWRRP